MTELADLTLVEAADAVALRPGDLAATCCTPAGPTWTRSIRR